MSISEDLNKSSEEGGTNINLFDDSSYEKEKKGSQRGSLKSFQNSEISQNNNISSSSEDLKENLSNNSIIKRNENKFDSGYYFGYQKETFDNHNEEKIIFNNKVDVLYYIMKESTINLIINYQGENKINS